jgi:uncharacterized tellurite resistance protein B-like protein
MIWLTLLAILILLIGLTLLISAIVLYMPFCNSPEKRWRDQVFDLLAAAQRREWMERNQLNQLGATQAAKGAALRDEAFSSCLADISVAELEEYPGIGPSTVAKLRSAGYNNLAAFRATTRDIPGLGEKRWSDINKAVNDLMHRAQNRLEKGDCRQAQELAGKLQALTVEYACLEVRTHARLQAAQHVTARVKELASVARQVTFLRWFRPLSEEPIVPTQVIEAPLPDLDTSVRSADIQALQIWQASARASSTARAHVPSASPSGPPRVPAAREPEVATNNRQAHVHASRSAVPREAAMVDDTQLLLMELTIKFAFGVARADGPVAPVRRDLIHEHVAKRFGYNRALLNRAEAYCAHFEAAAIDLEDCLRQIKERFTGEHRAALIRFAVQIAGASPSGKAKAMPFLQRLAQRLGVRLVYPTPTKESQPARPMATAPAVGPPISTPGPVAAMQPTAAPESAVATREESLRLLEIAPNTVLSPELIRRQWNLLSGRWNREKVVTRSPEVVRMAEEKLAKLRRAAEKLLAPFHQELEPMPAAAPASDPRENKDLDDVFGVP